MSGPAILPCPPSWTGEPTADRPERAPKRNAPSGPETGGRVGYSPVQGQRMVTTLVSALSESTESFPVTVSIRMVRRSVPPTST